MCKGLVRDVPLELSVLTYFQVCGGLRVSEAAPYMRISNAMQTQLPVLALPSRTFESRESERDASIDASPYLLRHLALADMAEIRTKYVTRRLPHRNLLAVFKHVCVCAFVMAGKGDELCAFYWRLALGSPGSDP